MAPFSCPWSRFSHSAGRLPGVWMPTDYYCPLKGGKILAQEAQLIQPFSAGQTLERAKWQRACAYDTRHKSRHCPLSLLTFLFVSRPSLFPLPPLAIGGCTATGRSKTTTGTSEERAVEGMWRNPSSTQTPEQFPRFKLYFAWFINGGKSCIHSQAIINA
jgi:hypothetical protein